MSTSANEDKDQSKHLANSQIVRLELSRPVDCTPTERSRSSLSQRVEFMVPTSTQRKLASWVNSTGQTSLMASATVEVSCRILWSNLSDRSRPATSHSRLSANSFLPNNLKIIKSNSTNQHNVEFSKISRPSIRGSVEGAPEVKVLLESLPPLQSMELNCE